MDWKSERQEAHKLFSEAISLASKLEIKMDDQAATAFLGATGAVLFAWLTSAEHGLDKEFLGIVFAFMEENGLDKEEFRQIFHEN